MKKSFVFYVSAVFMSVALAACGNKNVQEDERPGAATNVQSTVTSVNTNLRQEAETTLAELEAEDARRTVVLGGVAYDPEGIATNESGQVLSGTLVSNATIGGVDYAGRTKLVFYPNGKVKSARLGADTAINGVTYQADTDVTFYEGGALESGVLAGYTKINRLTFRRDTHVFFREDGKFWKAELY